MADTRKRKEDDIYTRAMDQQAGAVGTAAATRQTSAQMQQAEEARLLEAARIQRQTVGASYAEMYQRAQGQMSRGAMAGTAPGMSGGMATQRSSEIEGAQMRALGSISGQREQAMRDIDYQELMAPRQAFEFAQQQQMAQREEQMFNLSMIESRQGILDSPMSDEDKIEALVNTGMSLEEARSLIEEAGRGFFDRLRSGDASPFTAGLAAGGVGLAGVAGTSAASAGITAGRAALASKTGKGFTAALAGKLGISGQGTAAAAQWSRVPQGQKAISALKTTKFGKALAGKGITKAGVFKGSSLAVKALATNPVGWAILGTAVLVGAGYGIYKWGKNSDRW